MSKCFQFRNAMALFGCQCEVMVVFKLLFGLKLGNFYFGHIKLKFFKKEIFLDDKFKFLQKQYTNVNLTSNVMI